MKKNGVEILRSVETDQWFNGRKIDLNRPCMALPIYFQVLDVHIKCCEKAVRGEVLGSYSHEKMDMIWKLHPHKLKNQFFVYTNFCLSSGPCKEFLTSISLIKFNADIKDWPELFPEGYYSQISLKPRSHNWDPPSQFTECALNELKIYWMTLTIYQNINRNIFMAILINSGLSQFKNVNFHFVFEHFINIWTRIADFCDRISASWARTDRK